jgi:hypothetical protein
MIELLGLTLALGGIIFVGLVKITMHRDLERRHARLEQHLTGKDDLL